MFFKPFFVLFQQYILQAQQMSESPLVQMLGNITYSIDGDYTSLLYVFTTVKLIAMSYHPEVENLIYMLYATYDGGAYRRPQLQIWQIDNQKRSIVSNNTLSDRMNLLNPCQMEVGSRLLLIQCLKDLFIYGLTTNGKGLLRNYPYVVKDKSNFTGYITQYHIMRYGSIFGNRFAFYDGANIVITDFTFNDTNITDSSFRSLSLGIYNLLFSITLSQDYLIWAHQKINNTVVYTYLPCIIYGINQAGQACGLPNLIAIPMNYNITKNFRAKQGKSTDSKYVLWILIDGDIYRYQLQTLLPFLQQQFTGFLFDEFTANNNSILFFTSSGAYQVRSFQVATDPNEQFQYTFDGGINLAAINSARKQLTVFKGDIYQVGNQYLIIKKCSDYQAQINNTFCKCQQFDGIFCSLAKNSSNNQTNGSPSPNGLPSFGVPVIAVGSAVAITAIVLVSRLIYKKCKGPKNDRVPYQYDQADLMSFEL